MDLGIAYPADGNEGDGDGWQLQPYSLTKQLYGGPRLHALIIPMLKF